VKSQILDQTSFSTQLCMHYFTSKYFDAGQRKGSHVQGSGGLANMRYLVFDVVWKSLVEEVPECTISITADLTSYVVELNHTLVHALGV